jgi:PKD repeat protein
MSTRTRMPMGPVFRVAPVIGAVWLGVACSGDGIGPPDTAPTADFASACSNLTCSFTDRSRDSDGSLVAFHWDFGDGSAASTRNSAHAYAVAGTYTVNLTVTDNTGATARRSGQVTVADAQSSGAAPAIGLSQTAFIFCTPPGGGSTRVCGGQLSGELSITNTGSGTLNWTASSSRPWLSVSPRSGVAPSSHVVVSVNPAGLPASPGTFFGSVTISAVGASNSPQTVGVRVLKR